MTKRVEKPYVTREVSWMHFNKRLLDEASREDVPLLERARFLGIYINNLDEFYRIRVASLLRLLDLGGGVPLEERKVAEECLLEVRRLSREYSLLFERLWIELRLDLEREGIYFINEESATEEQGKEMLSYYMNNLNGATNPIFLDSIAFSREVHLKESLYFIVELGKHGGGSPELALIEIPLKEVGRFVELSPRAGRSYLVMVDDIVRYSLPYIFAGMDLDYYQAYSFRFIKDGELEIETDLSSSVLQKVSLGVKRRKRGLPIRLTYDASMPLYILQKLKAMAELSEREIVQPGGRYLHMQDLMQLPTLGRQDLCYPPQPPLLSNMVQYSQSILEQILEQDRGISFPYQSFDHFIRVLREAAISREVTEIRVTLYRVANSSKVVKALIAAAQNGKAVTAVVELMARFNEASNINWSRKMQEAGVNVVFGHEKIKIHSKLVHIKMLKGEIACIGTGNMHEGNAKVYTDYMLMTASRRITQDVKRVFDFIEKPYLSVRFNELLVSPNELRPKLNLLIDREIRNALMGKEAYIKLKLNQLVDRSLVDRLYKASAAGVRVELLVRGSCSLVPGVPGVSDNITVNAIIDRYLEHSRIMIFCAGGEPRYFIGSPDWMPRNLDKRIEVVCPVYDPEIQRELEMIVDLGLRDTSQGYYVNTHGGAPRRKGLPRSEWFRSQEALYNYYKSLENLESPE